MPRPPGLREWLGWSLIVGAVATGVGYAVAAGLGGVGGWTTGGHARFVGAIAGTAAIVALVMLLAGHRRAARAFAGARFEDELARTAADGPAIPLGAIEVVARCGCAREALIRALGRLRALAHPHAARPLEIDDADPAALRVVHEAAPGPDLRTVLRVGPLPPADAVDVARQLLALAAALVDAGVLADALALRLTPARIRLEARGAVRMFAVAQGRLVVTRHECAAASSRSADELEELGYAPPAPITGALALGHTIAALLFEMLTGRRYVGDATVATEPAEVLAVVRGVLDAGVGIEPAALARALGLR